ncbi:unnamed protein product (macronuclear) [Paramecium tetraurelia]|uniref:Myb-like domain-containing protein n=1 Tax=Paramecium tetraurelia TaxID=5888 RepID=A0BGG5_PARTE|nr:uncharacterized protein GSPATT00028667001 [Paramecium tetraurelia]CAK57632.1 unnamed protein product [Paramecium tetraurelia]|eukprot:XP_001425030.1 hypothetical protein (macronuclear) [Paramecium tetraurelia strain d4-2]
MNQEKDCSYMQQVKFDLRRRRIPNGHSVFDCEAQKRRNSFSLSSDACKSPQRKTTKYFENQNPGQNAYFWSLIKSKRNENEQFIQSLKSMGPIQVNEVEPRLQFLLRSFGYEDERSMLEIVENVQQNQRCQQWTQEESRILIWTICKLGVQHNSWKELGNLLNRSVKELKTHWTELIHHHTQRGLLWTAQEDQTLQSMIMNYLNNSLAINWKCMANVLNKSDKQSQDRWYNTIDPSISREAFKIEDDLQLLQLVQKYGKRWKRVEREWPLNRKRSRFDLKKRFYELLNQTDSGYDSDTSSNSSSKYRKLNQDDMDKIQKLISEMQISEGMQLENKLLGKDNLLKNKLLSIAKNDLDKMLNQQRKIKIQSASTPTDEKKYDIQVEPDEVIMNTPSIMNSLSRCLLNINLETEDDQLSIDKLAVPKVQYNVDSVEHLKHEDIFDIQFALVNDKTNTLYYANLEFMQQLINLITNQRKLMQLTDINKQPQKTKKKFSSQQLIQVYPNKVGLSQFGQDDANKQ